MQAEHTALHPEPLCLPFDARTLPLRALHDHGLYDCLQPRTHARSAPSLIPMLTCPHAPPPPQMLGTGLPACLLCRSPAHSPTHLT